MKKTILALIALPLIFVACGKQKTDSSLNGSWRGEVSSSSLKSIESALSGRAESDQVANEIIVYRIDKDSMETYRAKDNGVLNDQVEIAVGKYESKDHVISFNVAEHSCAKANPKYSLHQKIPYTVSADLQTLTLNIGLKKVILTKLDQVEANGLQQAMASAVTGCFSDVEGNPSKFKPGTVEKPKPPHEDVQTKKELEDATNEATDAQ